MHSKNNILQFAKLKQKDKKASIEIKTQHTDSLTQDNKVHNPMTPEGPLGDLIQYTTQWTNDAVSTLFDNVDTQLFEMAEKSENATDQNIYFDAMRIIRLRRSVAYEEFITQVSQSFSIDAIQSKKIIDNPKSELDDLSLVADDSLEEDLAIHNMIAKAERDNKEALNQLNQRLGYLYNGLKINLENNPMGPTPLCHSFALAVDTLEAEIKVKLLVFKLFDINLITNLHELYNPANKLLIEKGILPDLKVSYKGAVTKQAPPVTGGLGGLINTPVQEMPSENEGLSQFVQQPMGMTSNAGDAQAFALIQQLINQNKSVQQQIPQAQYASTDDVMASLSLLQTAPGISDQFNNFQGNGAATSNLLKEALKESLKSNQQKQAINQNDDDLIDVIGMLFDFILDDHNLVDSVKSLLSSLQIPIIKIALQDKAFFRNKAHPARKLLNELANASLGVTDNVNVQDNPLYLKLENIVTRVANEQTQESDVDFFDELLEDLHRFLTQFNQGLSNKKGPSKDAALKLVSTELSSRISTKELPHNIVLLLERVWKDVMFDIFFTDGMESDEWDMAMTFVDTLVWSIDPKTDIQSKKQLVRIIPGILNALNSGLDRIHYPKNLREQLLQDLQNCHLACMKGQNISDSELSQDNTAYITSKRLQNQTRRSSDFDEKNIAEDTAALDSLKEEGLSSEELDNIDAGVDIMLDGDLTNLDALDEENLLTSLEDGSEEAIADDGHDELIEDSYTQLARNLTSGAWVEFKGFDDKSYRAKISWMSEDASAYIFVTQTGQIAEKSLQGLSNALRNQQATVLDESPVFERAMDAVLEGLQEKTEH
ncbi:MAG: DUF1631 domain-containing protein [gamma proteobacterium symbiont of Lucinoma myriamae]|nr:DUF1631 domain-containing protein [gamma proteobacterium symbiont of Lucinoma myriamae]MCU7817501.1 DUF1631 domain-containing protein [gamma proteobacterium symbiont of Lucinoma myriamae]MCU7831078.1 DUF1631 domain-containing protein [gamma proteobacterium symbiont of Lucinoma myriamae]